MRSERAVLVVVVISLGIKLALLIPAHSIYPVRDAWDYFRTAQALDETGRYVTNRPPLYPGFLVGARRLAALGGEGALSSLGGFFAPPESHPVRAPSDMDMARFLQVLLSTLTLVLVFLLGRELFDARSGVAAAALFAFYPCFVGYTVLFWAETQFILLNTAWAVLLFRGIRLDSWRLLALSGVVLGLAALTRQTMLTFLPLLLVWMVMVGGRPLSASVRRAAMVLAAALLTIAPWTLRNAGAYDAFVPISPHTGLALIYGASENPLAEVKKSGATPFMGHLERDELLKARALDLIRADPAAYARRVLTKNSTMIWAPGSLVLEHLVNESYGFPKLPTWAGRALLVLIVVSYVLLVVAALIGGALAPAWPTTLLFVAMTAHASGMHAIATGFHRHRLYVTAFAVIYAGFLLSRNSSELRALLSLRRGIIAAIAIAMFALVIAFGDHSQLIAQWEAL